MNTFQRCFPLLLRCFIHAGFALVLACAVLAKASALPLAGQHGKALQHAIAELKCASNGISNDPPESKPAAHEVVRMLEPQVPASLGHVRHEQFSSMVHQLRDRLMHAPPVLFQNT